MQQPQLVLAIEPDLRQAAIVKRIVREKVLADVTVVDSRDAALEAMRTTVPDVLLLSALLSPRDEDELIAHLRTLDNLEHLQTHTIPQLASSITGGDAKPKGLLSAFRRKKEPEGAMAGCDPELFAEEVRTYLQRASEKKREIRSAPPGEARPVISSPAAPPPRRVESEPEPESQSGSAWSSPFEWRPAGSAAPAPTAFVEAVDDEPASSAAAFDATPFENPAFDMRPIAPVDPEPAFEEPAPFERAAFEPAAFEPAPVEPAAFQPAAFESSSFEASRPEPEPSREPEPLRAETAAFIMEPVHVPVPARTAPSARNPLTVRTPRGWWFEEDRKAALRVVPNASPAFDPDDEVRELLESLQVPAAIAGITYAKGCRIRRVRVTAP
jgi:CheY-like chemotaxis protein